MCHYWLHTFTVQLPNDSATNLRVAHNVTLVCNLSAAQNRRTAYTDAVAFHYAANVVGPVARSLVAYIGIHK